MKFEKYLISEANYTLDSTEKREWDALTKWAKSKRMKQYKNETQNPMWGREKGIIYLDGWALNKWSGFALYTEEGYNNIYISWVAGGGPSGNDSLYKGYALELVRNFKEHDDDLS